MQLYSRIVIWKNQTKNSIFLFLASSSISLTTPASPGEQLVRNNKLENIKKWTISTYKCSRQSLYERLGKTSKTVDPELEEQIEALRDTQRKYSNILRLAKTLSGHFFNMVQTQVIIQFLLLKFKNLLKDRRKCEMHYIFFYRILSGNVSRIWHTNLQNCSKNFSIMPRLRGT